ncbi:PTS sugar transporter subunit IIB [Amnibacterium flavum]|uniref:PTS EIIB type-3 domain-containing protein n=1 Tax=Amnibacterium flavum TaxID=2173173 RepID=A0A2V1HRX7_9MICO|nr:hypothetical protein [Amnibacterium flavum]PVZ95081.1 hypothetical protein DDQ50_00685 [Amnibacterium flavum]
MTTVALVCVAGVSGTFLARRMRESDPSLTVTVSSVTDLASAVRGADVILVAPQLATELPMIERQAGGLPVVVLPANAYGPGGSESAVHAVHDLVARGPLAYRETTSLTESKE